MSKTARDHYLARMQRVLDHIDRHLEDDLGLAVLADVAVFSRFHFHRQFSATFGIPAHLYVQLARLKRASWRLAYRGTSVTEIALEAGYEAPDAFARVFRQRIGQVAVGIPEIARLGAVACGLRASRRCEEQADADETCQ